MTARFSVLIPSYNREQHVRQAIDSVLSQTFTNYELFVIDDGSTDGTRQLLESYGPSIRTLHQQNQGPEVARNLAASQASGEYLALLDSDDLLTPGALAVYDRIITKLNSPPLLIGSMMYFRDGDPIHESNLSAGKIEAWKCPDFFAKDVGFGLSNSRIVIRKSVFEEIGGLRNTTPQTFHLDDFNLVMKAGTYGPFAIVKSPITVAYRAHESNSIRSLEAMVNGISTIIGSERAGEYPGGRGRRHARYAYIGGIAQLWIRNALKNHRYGLALGLMFRSAPMLAAAISKKLFSRFRRSRTELLSFDSGASQ